MAGRLRAGEPCLLLEMHAGVQAYLHWRNGYPPLYACMAEMSAETGLVLEYCLSTERAKERPEDLAAIQAQAEALWRRCGIPLRE